MDTDESKIVLKLRVKSGELQLEGSRQVIMDMLEHDLPKIIESISQAIPPETGVQKTLIQPTGETALQSAFSSPSASPNIDAEPPPSVQAKSCSEAIFALLSTPWGRKKPRTLSEIKVALDANALHYSGKVIGFTLTRLTRRQKLRRWKAEEGFIYTVGA